MKTNKDTVINYVIRNYCKHSSAKIILLQKIVYEISCTYALLTKVLSVVISPENFLLALQ